MAPIFTCFPHDNNKVITLHVNHVLGRHYPILADGVSKLLGLVKGKYHGMNGRFFYNDEGEWLMVTLEQLDRMPDFALTFNSDYVVQDKDWATILLWVQMIFNGEVDHVVQEQVENLIPKPGDIEDVSPQPLESPTLNDTYTFRYFVDESRDYALFEIFKPFTDRPFTAVVRQFKKRGYLPLFTAYYVSSAWGITNYDHLFLIRIWEHLGMEKEHGPIDLERRLKEDIAKCLPDNPGGPESEPELYRVSIGTLIDQWSNKRANRDFVKNECKKIKTLF
jgi:hypothetical protein